jgi:pimeloyl-ACP methyl ester carboxylesterase
MQLRKNVPAVVLVHGLWLAGWCMVLIAWRLRRCGFRTYRFSYASVRKGLRENAADLRKFADAIEASTLHFVGHSLGGVVIHTMFAQNPPPRPGRMVTLGSPHAGSQTARTVARAAWGRWILGKSIAELLARPSPRATPAREIGLIKGSFPIGLGRLLRGLSRPNDGVVSAADAELPGATDEITLWVAHTLMLVSPRVAVCVCQFLRFGHFVR